MTAGPPVHKALGCIASAASSSSPMSGISSGVQSWVLVYKAVGMGEAGLWYLGSSLYVCYGTAKQTLKACISPDSRHVGLVLGAMGVTRAQCTSHVAQGRVEADVPGEGTPFILCSSGHLLGSKHKQVPEEDTGPAVVLGQRVVGLTVPCPTICRERQLKSHSRASSEKGGCRNRHL